jgi:hypothetical protein
MARRGGQPGITDGDAGQEQKIKLVEVEAPTPGGEIKKRQSCWNNDEYELWPTPDECRIRSEKQTEQGRLDGKCCHPPADAGQARNQYGVTRPRWLCEHGKRQRRRRRGQHCVICCDRIGPERLGFATVGGAARVAF